MATSAQKRLLQDYGPWALVTGASSGIGYQLALQLSDIGFNLVIHGRNRSALEVLANKIHKNGNEVLVISGDFSNEQDNVKLLESTANLPIGLLVASAGYATSGLFADSKLDEEIDMLQVNVQAVLTQVYNFIQRFKIRNQSGIILISSIVGFQGVPYAAHYAATKAYIQTLGEGLSRELKKEGIDILVAAPGPVHTGFAGRAQMKMKQALQPADVARACLKNLGKKSTLKPGWLSKLLYYSLAMLPRSGKIRIMEKVMKDMVQRTSDSMA
ncbi:MAG: SDR family NAD(P)-dependent oxidoreductase [Flavihumibacter sp.]|jgi:hypothetical protein|nr:SDR family NAD(P)-dependent oxidoreductase [Flavihumibacter sp.]